jgi:YHS domain-containing protein
MKPILFIILIGMLTVRAEAQKSQVFVTDEGAIRGYDPVAYFTEGKPSKGKQEFTYVWNGASWHFTSAQNREVFKASPEKYAPQYGGYCAYGTADGHKAITEPDAWTVSNGKLYLNHNRNVQTRWRSNQEQYIRKADANWPTIKDKP